MSLEAMVNAGSGLILGIDIGGTNLRAGIATQGGALLAEARSPSLPAEGPDAIIERVVAMAWDVVDRAGVTIDDIERVGIGCGGPLDPWRGVILNALNNPGWVNVPVVARIKEALGRPTFLDNDANAAALAEHRFGAGRGADNLVYLTVSTGVGGEVLAGGRLLHGENGNAAELGHISVDLRGRACHCGSVGCLETYCSGTSIVERARERLAATHEPSALRGTDPALLTSEDVARAAAAGDPVARDLWDETMELLGAGVVSIIHAFNPRVVILGGGVTRAGALLFEPVRRIVAKRAMPWFRDAVEVVPAALGDRTGILGAVAVATAGPVSRPGGGGPAQ